MVFLVFIFFYFLFDIDYIQRIYEATPLLLLIFLKTFEILRRETFHSKTRENKLKSFPRKCFGENVSKLELSPHEIKFHNSFLNLLPDEVMANINVLSP